MGACLKIRLRTQRNLLMRNGNGSNSDMAIAKNTDNEFAGAVADIEVLLY